VIKQHSFIHFRCFDHVKECDEREYINTVIRENSVSPHFIVVDNHGPYADIEEVLKIQDEPMTSSNVYVNWLSYKAAKAKGVKIILDGYDGDTTISHGLGILRNSDTKSGGLN
jgi:asparagine synthase (glutamine-hydrolysing)